MKGDLIPNGAERLSEIWGISHKLYNLLEDMRPAGGFKEFRDNAPAVPPMCRVCQPIEENEKLNEEIRLLKREKDNTISQLRGQLKDMTSRFKNADYWWKICDDEKKEIAQQLHSADHCENVIRDKDNTISQLKEDNAEMRRAFVPGGAVIEKGCISKENFTAFQTLKEENRLLKAKITKLVGTVVDLLNDWGFKEVRRKI